MLYEKLACFMYLLKVCSSSYLYHVQLVHCRLSYKYIGTGNPTKSWGYDIIISFRVSRANTSWKLYLLCIFFVILARLRCYWSTQLTGQLLCLTDLVYSTLFMLVPFKRCEIYELMSLRVLWAKTLRES